MGELFLKALLRTCLIAGCLELPAWSQAPCRAGVRADVPAIRAEVSLADLLLPESCPELLAAAAGVRLGSAPLRGSPRVLEGEQVRALLQALAHHESSLGQRGLIFTVPERVVVRVEADIAMPGAAAARPARTKPRPASTLVRPGQIIGLLWEQGGVRLTMPATCLEAGDAGQTVRARIAHSGRVIRAVVLAGGGLRAIS